MSQFLTCQAPASHVIAPVRGQDPDPPVREEQVAPAHRLAFARASNAAAALRTLTPRQSIVLQLVVAGYRNKQIAGQLGIDEKTVKMHRAALLKRLGAGSSAEAVKLAVEASFTDGLGA